MNHIIIDTNVPVKAASVHLEDEVDRKCASECLNYLEKLLHSSDILVLDSAGEILKEYRKNINMKADSSIATVFLNWVYRSILTERIERHTITKTGENTYAEFPASVDLKHFDCSDRKFVALSKAHPCHPPIVNGSDTDWWLYKDALEKEGIHVVFLCKEYMQAKCRGKKKQPKNISTNSQQPHI